MKHAASELLIWVFITLFLSILLISSSVAVGETLDLGKISSTVWLDGKKTEVVSAVKAKKVAVLQFWASWCKGCGGNMEVLSRIARDEPNLGFFSVSIDEELKDATTYFSLRNNDEYIAAFPTALWDPEMKFAGESKVGVVPYFILVTEKGEVLKRFVGHVTKDVKAEVKSLVLNHLRSEGEKNTKEGKK